MKRFLSPTRPGSLFRSALTLQPLEDRSTPSISAALNGGVLVVTGDQGNDNVRISARPDGDILVRSVSGGQFLRMFDGDAVQSIQIDLGQGSNTLNVDLTTPSGADEEGTSFWSNPDLRVTGGGRADQVTVNLGDAENLGDVTLAFELGGGNDTLNVTGGADINGALSLTADTGGGRDKVTVALAGGVNGASDMTFNLGAGNDTLDASVGGDLNTAANITVDAGGGNDDVTLALGGAVNDDATISMTGGGGNDAFALSAAGEVNGNLGVTIDGGTGNDDFTGDLGGDVNGNLTVDAMLAEGNDSFAMTAAGNLGGDVDISVDAGGGNDDVALDLGGDIDGVFMLGVDLGAGNDSIALAMSGSVNSDDEPVIEVDGGAGIDTAALTLGANEDGTPDESLFDALNLAIMGFETVTGLPTFGDENPPVGVIDDVSDSVDDIGGNNA